MLTALAQDYYPRVAAAEPADIQGLIERRTRLVMAIAVPIILATLALSPVLLEALYAHDFAGAARILDWQLIGDLLKLPAWALGFAILARGAGKTYFMVELIGGATLILGVWVATGVLGVEGAGVGYLLSYAAYYLAVWVAARTVAPVVPGRLQLVVLVLVGALVVANLGLSKFMVLRSVLLLIGATAFAAVAWPRVWRLHREGEL
jgi:PST family polysaccharide transporter